MQVKNQDAKKIITETAEKVCEIYMVVPNKKSIDEFFDLWKANKDDRISITIAERVADTFFLRINLYSPGGNTVDINTFLGHTVEVIENLEKAGLNFYRPYDIPLDSQTYGHTLRISVP